LEALADILVSKGALPDPELVGTFRSLVESVVIQPHKAGEQYEVIIRGYLAKRYGNRGVGSIDGSGRGTRTPDPRIMIPVL